MVPGRVPEVKRTDRHKLLMQRALPAGGDRRASGAPRASGSLLRPGLRRRISPRPPFGRGSDARRRRTSNASPTGRPGRDPPQGALLYLSALLFPAITAAGLVGDR